MSRVICPQCRRAQKVCICDFISPIDNRIELGILQHPTETQQVKGTAIIAELAFQHCQLWVGESLTELPELRAWLTDGVPVRLLYPKIEGQPESYQAYSIDEVRQDLQAGRECKILVLDGTWRKTYKMMQLNPELRALDRVELAPGNPSDYKVRKQKDAQSLSTIEALVELFAQIENDADKFQPALDAFECMQQQQLAFRKV